ARYDYGPFGEAQRVTGDPDACPFGFQTKYLDSETGLYYFPERYYDPRLGRWLSRDPIGEGGGFNLYAYCGNDPVNRHDPLGLEPEEDLLTSHWSLVTGHWEIAAALPGCARAVCVTSNAWRSIGASGNDR